MVKLQENDCNVSINFILYESFRVLLSPAFHPQMYSLFCFKPFSVLFKQLSFGCCVWNHNLLAQLKKWYATFLPRAWWFLFTELYTFRRQYLGSFIDLPLLTNQYSILIQYWNHILEKVFAGYVALVGFPPMPRPPPPSITWKYFAHIHRINLPHRGLLWRVNI